MANESGKNERPDNFEKLSWKIRVRVVLRTILLSCAVYFLVDLILQTLFPEIYFEPENYRDYIMAGYTLLTICIVLYFFIHERNRAGIASRFVRTAAIDRKVKNRLLASAGIISEAVITIDPDGYVTYMNRRAETLTGWNLPCAEGRDLREILKLANPENGRPIVRSNLSLSLEKSAPGNKRRVIVISSTGKETVAEERISPVVDDRGNPLGAALVFRDVSERMLADDVIEFSGIGLMQYTIDGTITDIDRGSLRILDLTETYPEPTKAAGKKLSDLITYSRSFRKVQKEILRRGRVKNLEYSIVTLKGKTKWLRHDSRILVDGVTGEKLIRVIIRDITGRKAAQCDLEEKSFYLDQILNSSDEMAVIATDKLFTIKHYNKTAERIFGVTSVNAIGKTMIELHGRDKMDLTSFDKAIEAIKYGGRHTYRAVRKIGTEKRTIEAVVSGMKCDCNRLKGYIITVRDITEKAPETEESEQRKITLNRPAESSEFSGNEEVRREIPVEV